mgnify:CR=1 FL=1
MDTVQGHWRHYIFGELRGVPKEGEKKMFLETERSVVKGVVTCEDASLSDTTDTTDSLYSTDEDSYLSNEVQWSEKTDSNHSGMDPCENISPAYGQYASEYDVFRVSPPMNSLSSIDSVATAEEVESALRSNTACVTDDAEIESILSEDSGMSRGKRLRESVLGKSSREAYDQDSFTIDSTESGRFNCLYLTKELEDVPSASLSADIVRPLCSKSCPGQGLGFQTVRQFKRFKLEGSSAFGSIFPAANNGGGKEGIVSFMPIVEKMENDIEDVEICGFTGDTFNRWLNKDQQETQEEEDMLPIPDGRCNKMYLDRRFDPISTEYEASQYMFRPIVCPR